MPEDIATAHADDNGCWNDMSAALKRIKSGSCRSEDWNAPLNRNFADIGEVKRKRRRRLYRLYVWAPRNQPNLLILLHFSWKDPGKPGLVVQDQQIDEAFRRQVEIASGQVQARG